MDFPKVSYILTVSRLEIEWRWKVLCNGAQVGAIHLSKLSQMHVPITPQSKSNNLLDSQEFGCILCSYFTH
jgi:hypothetical protein